MKNKNIKDKDIDGIVEVLDKYKEYGETAEGRETDVIHWRNFEKIAREILSKLKENEIVLRDKTIEQLKSKIKEMERKIKWSNIL